MLRLGGLLFVVAGLLAGGCSIDRVEWESDGFPTVEVRRALEEEHGAESPTVECIQREVQGAEYACRAHAGGAEFHCHVTTNTPRKRVYELNCEARHDDGATDGDGRTEPAADAPAEH
jgi:hypothetical protein